MSRCPHQATVTFMQARSVLPDHYFAFRSWKYRECTASLVRPKRARRALHCKQRLCHVQCPRMPWPEGRAIFSCNDTLALVERVHTHGCSRTGMESGDRGRHAWIPLQLRASVCVPPCERSRAQQQGTSLVLRCTAGVALFSTRNRQKVRQGAAFLVGPRVSGDRLLTDARSRLLPEATRNAPTTRGRGGTSP
jgi:hypothetical protein